MRGPGGPREAPGGRGKPREAAGSCGRPRVGLPGQGPGGAKNPTGDGVLNIGPIKASQAIVKCFRDVQYDFHSTTGH